jgi:hypothetical protein
MERIVHIVPLGWEYDRVVLPVRLLKAHRVYLLCKPSEDPERRYFLEKVTRRLERDGVQVKHRDVDSNLDTIGLMREVSGIIIEESAAGNRILINIASAGKVAALAVSLAAMAHLPRDSGGLYYPIAKDYTRTEKDRLKHGLARGLSGDPVSLPHFRIQLPAHPADWLLADIAASPGHRLGYDAMIPRCIDWKISGFKIPSGDRHEIRMMRNRNSVQFNKRVVQKLRNLDLVKIENEGKARALILTVAGLHVASLCPAGPTKNRLENGRK